MHPFVNLGFKLQPYILKYKRAFKFLILTYCIAYLLIVKQYLGFEYAHLTTEYKQISIVNESDAVIVMNYEFEIAT